MIYILFAILALLIASIILSVYILKWLSIIRQAQVLQNMSLTTIYDKEQIIIKDVIDVQNNICDYLDELDTPIDEIHKMTYDHASEMEAISAFMKISTDTLVDICEKLKDDPRKHELVQNSYKILVDIRDNGGGNIDEAIGFLGEYLND